LVSTVIKNWDKKNWLSSKNYILDFNKFIIKSNRLNSNSTILDIGCGRGKITGSLSSKLKFKHKPVGLDLVNHRDRDKRINFKKIDAIKFLKKSSLNFDLIIIKQTIHLFKFNEIKKLLNLCKKKLNPKGKILIFSLETAKNEIPTFSIFKEKLNKSLKRDQKIFKMITKLNSNSIIKKFSFIVKISKKKYIEMVKNRYMSVLLNLNLKDIDKGIKELSKKYKKKIEFNDKLVCIIIKK